MLCTNCKLDKPKDEFPRAGKEQRTRPGIQARGGRQLWCAECKREQNRASYVPRENSHTHGRGRVKSNRKYFPKAGDRVYVNGIEPHFTTFLLSVDEKNHTARIRHQGQEFDLPWGDFRSYESVNRHERSARAATATSG